MWNSKVSQMFEGYRQAYDSMEADPAIKRARQAIEQYQASLEKLKAPYREKMAETEAEIVEVILVQRESLTLHGVYARYARGRVSRSWKSIATDMQAPQELIDEHTKVGKPSVSVKVVMEDET